MSGWNFVPWVYEERDGYKNISTATKEIRDMIPFNTDSKMYLCSVGEKIHLRGGYLFLKFSVS